MRHGVIAGFGGTQRITRQLPHALAMEMLLTGERIGAERAERWGLVNKVVPAEQLLPTAQVYAARIAANAPLAVQATKELALRSLDMSPKEGMRLEQLTSHILQTSEDVDEGRLAFIEKRTPVYKGR